MSKAAADDAGEDGDDAGRARLDVWLWRARFFKTRALAAKAVAGGVRVNAVRTTKAGVRVHPGDVLTFAQGAHVRVIEIVAPGARRGPAAEAQALYRDRAPPAAQETRDPPGRAGPRPTGRDRRLTDALRGSDT